MRISDWSSDVCSSDLDVVHLAAAHALGRGFAHGPAQGLDEVRLAAAVGADDAGDAGLDDQLGGVDERLESAQTKLVELHHAWLGPLRRQVTTHAPLRSALSYSQEALLAAPSGMPLTSSRSEEHTSELQSL